MLAMTGINGQSDSAKSRAPRKGNTVLFTRLGRPYRIELAFVSRKSAWRWMRSKTDMITEFVCVGDYESIREIRNFGGFDRLCWSLNANELCFFAITDRDTGIVTRYVVSEVFVNK
jgi:hypothetical protein